jgi:arylsulfatase A-like enzyme
MKYKIAALFFSAVALLVSSAVLAAERPNIILILCDDLGYGDLACYGAPKIKTPALDKMAAEGMKFTDFHTGSPLCSPSRSAFLTGCYPRRIGLAKGVLRPDSDRGIHSSEKTMAELLKSCGYATACIGKWHLGFLPEFLPNRKGFDYYYGLWHNLDDWETKFYADQGGVPIMRNEEAVMRPARPEMMTELYTAEAVKFIEQNKSRRFFLYLAHIGVLLSDGNLAH